MFERFTDKARTVVILARAKATERGDQIRPVRAPATLRELGIDPAQARQGVLDELRHASA